MTAKVMNAYNRSPQPIDDGSFRRYVEEELRKIQQAISELQVAVRQIQVATSLPI
jgi:hypothetical protein